MLYVLLSDNLKYTYLYFIPLEFKTPTLYIVILYFSCFIFWFIFLDAHKIPLNILLNFVNGISRKTIAILLCK